MKEFERFDMKAPPVRTKWYLRPLTYLLSAPDVWKHRCIITKTNAKRFIPIGTGTMIHDMDGFRVSVTDADGDVHEMVKNVPSLYSCHIEYEYLGKYGDCVDLNTLTDTWYIYPEPEKCDFAVTKMALATEELYYSRLRKGL